jgi:hypothetical protein
MAKITATVDYEVSIPYEEVINYNNSAIVICKEHHECSCLILA